MNQSKYERKEKLNPFPQCRQCLAGLAKTAAAFVSQGAEDLLPKAEAAALEELENSRDLGLTSPEIASRMIRRVRALSGKDDPYREFKTQEMLSASQAVEQARPWFGDDLAGLVSLAALGNSLDFFKPPKEAMAEVAQRAQEPFVWEHNDIPRLDAALSEGCDLVLYLTDNSGEIHFDLPLYEHLRGRAGRVVMVVKGGPALNDLTRVELETSGLLDRVPDLANTGADGVGVEWGNASQDFLRLTREADLIISKGMANLETIATHPLPAPVFFIFRVKCDPMRDFLQAGQDAFWAMWRDADISYSG